MGLLARLLRALNSETDPAQISLALCFALILGFTPLFSLHNLVVLLLVLVLRVNLSTVIAATLVFSGLAYGLDPLFHQIGLAALTAEGLSGFWTGLYNTTWFRFGHLNNSVVMGSLLASLALFVPVFFVGNLLIRRYREHVLAWVNRLRIVRVLKGSRFYQLYQSVSAVGEGR